MSQVFVEIVQVESVEPHPNADKLELVKFKGFQSCYTKGEFKVGDHAVYFPPDILLPPETTEKLGVTKFLKHALFNDTDGERTQCRVAAARIRMIPSYGFLLTMAAATGGRRETYRLGDDVSHWFGAKKYFPPVKLSAGDAEAEHPAFHRYTDIERFQNFPTVVKPGEYVRITEKIHGTNSRVGVINVDGEFQFMAGSHTVRRKPVNGKGQSNTYWKPLENEGVLALLNDLCDGQHNVIIFGEIFGAGTQDLDYGLRDSSGYRVFDIAVNGKYLDWNDLFRACRIFEIPTVPLLYHGPFSPELVEQFTFGATTLAGPESIRSKFKGREGIVVTPIFERYSDELGGRTILKSVSADFYDRKGAEDNE